MENQQPFASLPSPHLAEMRFATPLTSTVAITDEELYIQTGVRIAFTERLAGFSPEPYKALNLSEDVGDVPAAVRSNRRVAFDTLGIYDQRESLINPKQVHGDTVIMVGEDIAASQAEAKAGADGVVCTQKDIPVMLLAADCVLVVCVAPNGAFAVVHSGWRGSLAGIAGKGLKALAQQAGVEPGECNCYIGPHIESCCYEVSAELMEKFTAAFGAECDPRNNHLSLAAAVIASLLEAGAVPERIINTGLCTCHNNKRFFSYRAENGVCGRQGAIVMRKDPPDPELYLDDEEADAEETLDEDES